MQETIPGPADRGFAQLLFTEVNNGPPKILPAGQRFNADSMRFKAGAMSGRCSATAILA